MSRRFHAILSRFTPELEIYSIDEAFLRVSPRIARDPEAMTALGREIKDTLRRLIGVPVCVGIAETTGAVTYSRVTNYLLSRPSSMTRMRWRLTRIWQRELGHCPPIAQQLGLILRTLRNWTV